MTLTEEDKLEGGAHSCTNPTHCPQNNLNRGISHHSHTRTHSHPLPGEFYVVDTPPETPPSLGSSSNLTEALNLDFVNIPAGCAIPAAAMQKYLGEERSTILVDLEEVTDDPTSEVTKVLDNFNLILEQITLQDDSDCSPSSSKFVTPSCSTNNSATKIKNVLTSALLRKEEEEEDEDFLIVVENGVEREEEDGGGDEEEEEENDELCPMEEDFLEGYESDRPMVRASMRKLRPIKVKLRAVTEAPEEIIQEEINNSGDLLSVLVIEEVSNIPLDSVPSLEVLTSPSEPLHNIPPIIIPAPTLPESLPSPPPTPTPPPITTRRSLTPAPLLLRRRGAPSSLTGRWPHRLSSVLALLGCTLGLNNVCRFGLLSVSYGANFVVQWVFLSLLLGVPLLTFHMSIGQYLNSGIIGMWKISPIFQGIGVGLLFSQALIGLYSTVGVSWMLIYFRDSFITRGDQYRWGRCSREFRECSGETFNSTGADLGESVPDYFTAVVLQRTTPDFPSSVYVPNSLKFTVAFNLAVVWMLVFVSLSKGLKSYGKVVHGFVLAPVAAIFILTIKMFVLVEQTSSLFGQTAWLDFFFNTQTWVVAAREVFFTWGLLGACVMQVTSHNRSSTHPLKSDAVIVVLVTTVVLLLSAFIGNSCLSIIEGSVNPQGSSPFQHYSYIPSSFESDRTYKFLGVAGTPPKPEDGSQTLNHNPLLMGVRILRSDGKSEPTISGYQVLRLATELFPTAMAILSPQGISPFWTVLFYFTLVLFGIAQQLAIWHTVIKGIIAIKYKLLKEWETTITFFVCSLGFALSLPLCTETGIFVTYFLDYSVGSGWWIMVLYFLQLVAVFIVRGAPYCGENIVTVLFSGRGRLSKVLAPLLSFVWNVVMPVALAVLAVASFQNGNVRELYDWNPNRGYIFWPSWTREVGSLLQLLPILCVPFVAIVQSCRYLSTGTSDIFERMHQLYRPSTRLRFGSRTGDEERGGASNGGRSEDPPPKYTPPPSYSTATGAKIARFLRNSIRRSMRRIQTPQDLPPPPNYASVILEIAQNQRQQTLSAEALEPPQYSEATSTSASAGEFKKDFYSHTLTPSQNLKERSSIRRISSEINSRDIARMLRARAELLEGQQPLEGRPPFDLLSFNRSRNRNSNDSQLALISDGYLYESLSLQVPSTSRHSEA